MHQVDHSLPATSGLSIPNKFFMSKKSLSIPINTATASIISKKTDNLVKHRITTVTLSSIHQGIRKHLLNSPMHCRDINSPNDYGHKTWVWNTSKIKVYTSKKDTLFLAAMNAP